MVLFDIDGTLIRRAGPLHRDVLVSAVRRVTGMETTTGHIATQGMLDRDIIRLMLTAAGARPAFVRKHMPEVVRQAQSLYCRSCPDLQKHVCPGVRSVLSRLQRRGLLVGLVTGNLTRIGWKKMESSGLKPYFHFGMFAEMGRTRAELVKLAKQEALAQGWIDDRAPISLIGDHQNDISAAKTNAVRAIAVATGLSTKEDLASLSPDLLLDDLRQLRLRMLL